MLPPGDMTLNRGILEDSLPDTCMIYRATGGSADGAGGFTGGSVSVAGTSICRVSPTPLQPDERMIAGQLNVIQAWQVTFPANTDVDNNDRIQSNGRLFEVIAVRGPRTWELGRRVVCREVRR